MSIKSITDNIQVAVVSWSEQQQALSEVRREVFITEQKVPEELEWDDIDADCRHVLASDTSYSSLLQIPVGTGRLLADGQIGRMAVRKEYRRQGIGYAILQKLIELAICDGHKQIYLHAQLTAVPFYKQAGFKAQGETFMDAGIPHIKMYTWVIPGPDSDK